MQEHETEARHAGWLREGISRFNAGEFWHAHEAWERIWLELPGEERQFFQGLIQLAAACYHLQRGNDRGAVRLFERAAGLLGRFAPGHRGIDRSAATAFAARERSAAADRLAGVRPGTVDERVYPRLVVTDGAG